MRSKTLIAIASLLFAVTGCATFGALTKSEQNFRLFSDAYEQFHQAHYRNSVILFEKYLSSDSSYFYHEAFAFMAESYKRLGEPDSGKIVYSNAIDLLRNRSSYDRKFDLAELIQWAKDYPAFPTTLTPQSGFTLNQVLPTAISKIEPAYPPSALKDKLAGYTLIALAVDSDGVPLQTKLLKTTSAVFSAPSQKAAMGWRFTPYLRFGRHIATWISVPFYFTISNQPERSYLKPEPDDIRLPSLLTLGDTTIHPTIAFDTTNHSNPVQYEKPRVLDKVEPTYPKEELSRGDEADVYVRVWISPGGYPLQAVVFKSSDSNFNRAAADAAMKWVFKAPTINGKPMSIWITIPFRFRLNQ
jgi:TonB family protein